MDKALSFLLIVFLIMLFFMQFNLVNGVVNYNSISDDDYVSIK